VKALITMKSLSSKIGLGYVVLISINIAIAIFAIYYINQLGSPVERVLKEKYQNLNAAQSMIQALDQQNLVLQAMLEEKIDSSLINSFHTYKNEFYNWHQKAIEGIALPSEPIILDSIMFNYRIYLVQSDKLRSLLEEQTPRVDARNFYSDVIIPRMTKVDKLCRHLEAVNQEAIADADQRARIFSRQATYFILLFSVIAIVISILASIRFTRGILKPVKATTETVKKIGQGQLNQKVNITTDDEIAELGREFNKMTERLAAYEKMNIDQILLEKKKSEALMEGMPVSIFVTDENQRISLMNRQAMELLGIGANSWQDKTVSAVVKDIELQELLAGKASHELSEGKPVKTLVVLERGESLLYFMARQIEVKMGGEKIKGRVTVLQDVTSFKNLDHLKSEFMATISHEFRTPLTSINMAVDILLKEVKGSLNPQQRELLQDARKDSQRLKMLVKDLLDLSRLESGNYPFRFASVNVAELLDYSLQPLRLLVKEKNLRLDCNIPPEIINIKADFHQLARVITNLAENAVQHTPSGGQILIAAGLENKMYKFCISDTGDGIPEEAIDLIFDKFVQIKNFEDSESGNIGLGLAIARGIIRTHGGDIWVESTLGEGSRFFFTIPFEIPEITMQEENNNRKHQ
jgi:NtrC-family two-component system sensor histidine kinase KinB